MRAANESFDLVYTRIADDAPIADHQAAEAWRASGCGLRVSLHEEPGTRKCTAVDTCAAGSALWPFGPTSRACADDELAMIDAPPGLLARTLVLSNPYPILEPAGRYCGSSG
jgi:hypothetical protein